MTGQHDAYSGAQWADQRWGVDLRAAVRDMAEQHAICEACIRDKLRDFDGVDDPSSALAVTIQFLNAERIMGQSLNFGSIFGNLFGQGGEVQVGQALTPALEGGEFIMVMGFPTPPELTDEDKRAILTSAGRGIILDQRTNVWFSGEHPILGGNYSGKLARAIAWERLLIEEEVYRHYKGGVYVRGCDGRSSEDGSDIVVYEHLWPHEPEIWVRPKAEFEEEGRFVRLTV